MTRAPIRIRTFILGTVLVLLLAPALAGGAAWLIDRDHQQADIQHRLNTAVAYLASHRSEIQQQATIQGFANLVDRLDLLAQLTLIEKRPPGKSQLYVSPALSPALQKQEAARQGIDGKPGTTPATASPASRTRTPVRSPTSAGVAREAGW